MAKIPKNRKVGPTKMHHKKATAAVAKKTAPAKSAKSRPFTVTETDNFIWNGKFYASNGTTVLTPPLDPTVDFLIKGSVVPTLVAYDADCTIEDNLNDQYYWFTVTPDGSSGWTVTVPANTLNNQDNDQLVFNIYRYTPLNVTGVIQFATKHV